MRRKKQGKTKKKQRMNKRIPKKLKTRQKMTKRDCTKNSGKNKTKKAKTKKQTIKDLPIIKILVMNIEERESRVSRRFDKLPERNLWGMSVTAKMGVRQREEGTEYKCWDNTE